jgi:hypothetical protein
MRTPEGHTMPVPIGTDTAKITYGGTTGVAGQGWSSGFWVNFGLAVPPTQAQWDAYSILIAAIVDSRMGTLASRWDATTNYSRFRTDYYAGGSLRPTLVSAPPPGGATGSGSRTLPGFCALVASLRTGNPMRHGRGRMYLPATGITLTGDGETDGTTCTAYSTNMANMFTSVNAVPAPWITFGLVVVASHVTGFVYPVTNVVVDSKIDVQHRRTDKLGADFITSTHV